MGGKRYTPLEDAILHGISERREVLIEQMHRLPGRTWFGARARALALGITFRATKWSRKDVATLRRIYKSENCIKLLAARLLPHHSYAAVKMKAIELGVANVKRSRKGYGYSPVFLRIEQLLAGGRMDSIAGLAAEIGVGPRTVHSAIQRQHGIRVRVGDHRRCSNGRFENLWVLGAGPDASVPQGKSAKERSRDHRARQRIPSGAADPFGSVVSSLQQVMA